MSDERPRSADHPDLAQPARFTRDTLVGCLGLGCILLTLPLLWLAVGVGAGWLSHVLPVLAFVAAIGGAALTLRVPGGSIARSTDPQRPLTHTGATPTIERPATRANRMAWACATALLLGALGGYIAEITHPGSPGGLALMLATGALIVTQGILVGWERLPAPALRWLRLTIYGAAGRQSALLLAIGFIILSGALFLALLDGFVWGPLGLALLVAALVVITPLARRAPRRHGPLRMAEPRTTQPD
jgi:hypothetical protein